MSTPWPVIAVTAGEPAGVGPEICLRLPDFAREHRSAARIVVLADRSLLTRTAAALQLPVVVRDWDPALPVQAGTLDVLHLPLAASVHPGRLDPANSPCVLALLDRALAGCRSGEFAAMVTAPVHKGVINDAGIAFTGHTAQPERTRDALFGPAQHGVRQILALGVQRRGEFRPAVQNRRRTVLESGHYVLAVKVVRNALYGVDRYAVIANQSCGHLVLGGKGI